MRQVDSRCPTCGQKRQRTPPQNARYWALLRELARVNREYPAETWHEYFKRKYLPPVERELPNWETVLIPMSTSRLPIHADPNNPNEPNWDSYMLNVEVFCAENGVYLQDGN